MYIVEQKINEILDNLKTELENIEDVGSVMFYDGEFIGNDFKISLKSSKASVFLDLVEIDTFESEIQHGEDCRLFINLYVVAGNNNRAYDKGNKNTSIVCINAIESIKRNLRNNFLNVNLNTEPVISGAKKIFNSTLESKGSTSAYIMTLMYEFTYIKDLEE